MYNSNRDQEKNLKEGVPIPSRFGRISNRPTGGSEGLRNLVDDPRKRNPLLSRAAAVPTDLRGGCYVYGW